MNVAVITGLVGALVGASVSIFTTWLTQRSQLERELAQRRFGELTRWTGEKRMMFRDIHVATNDWSHLLRRVARDDGRRVSDKELREVERRLHGLVYDATLLCSKPVYDLVDDAEQELRRLTVSLGRATEYDPAGSAEQARLIARHGAAEDFPALREIRLRLMNAMQAELTPSLVEVEEVDRPAPVSRQ